jgi:hypothetical protein
MKPPYEALKRIIDTSVDDGDLSEEFQWFAEDHLNLNSESEYLPSVMRLPVLMRRAYLALQADTSISGDGFIGYYEESRNQDFYMEVAEGFRLIGKPDSAAIFIRGIEFLRTATGAARTSIVAMDEATDDIHGEYFRHHKDVAEKVGAFVRRSKSTLLK